MNRVHEIFRQVHLTSLVSWFPQRCAQATKSQVARRLVDIFDFEKPLIVYMIIFVPYRCYLLSNTVLLYLPEAWGMIK